MTSPTPSQKAVLIILDGFGIGKEGPFNAILNAKMPFYKSLLEKYPHSQLLTHGDAVGLPDGVMGNSEVGHMTMGAGRIIYQDLVRINHAIRDKTLGKNAVLLKTLRTGAQKTGRVHLMGLVSDGGVHSHIDHLLALLDLCLAEKVPHVSVHAFLDGRDTPPDSALGFVEKVLAHPAFQGPKPVASFATAMGRYWGMDRDKRWDRIEKAYAAMTGNIEVFQPSKKTEAPILQAIALSYQNGKNDEFIEPVLLDREAAFHDGDSIVFFNYRSDRAREISEKILSNEKFTPSAFCGMTVYDRKLPLPAAFDPQNLKHIFGEWVAERNLTQLRTAETEKYAHVTFFFNGGKEEPFAGEDRVLVASPRDVATYDLKPEMSALEVATGAASRISAPPSGRPYDFILMNFANADMVGHTGVYSAAVKAMETLDQCLEKVIGAAEKNGYHVLLTADHGNAEEMCDSEGRPHTQHTLNPVPAVWVEPGTAVAPKNQRKRLQDGGLSDVMPTLCELMNLPIPAEVTGKSLLPR
jgi:2,3-bisphosphoglycerate-independent phosphoglycerate mutase